MMPSLPCRTTLDASCCSCDLQTFKLNRASFNENTSENRDPERHVKLQHLLHQTCPNSVPPTVHKGEQIHTVEPGRANGRCPSNIWSHGGNHICGAAPVFDVTHWCSHGDTWSTNEDSNCPCAALARSFPSHDARRPETIAMDYRKVAR